MSDNDLFPYSIARTLEPYFQQVDGVDAVLRRSLFQKDPNHSVGIAALNWTPGERLIGQFEPVMGDYFVNVQVLCKNTNAEEGEQEHAILSKRVLLELYRNTALRTSVMQLRDSLTPPFERMMDFKVLGQRFAQDQISGEFTFLSGIDITFTTELVLG